MDKTIAQIIGKAVDGGRLDAGELGRLLAVDCLSEEGFMIQHASRKVSSAASKGKAEVHAQVGVNAGPCPKNCQFCSFAAINKVFTQEIVYGMDEIIENSLKFEADGANAIYLMTTATFKLDDYLRLAKEVRGVLKPDTPMIANVGDFDQDEARAIKKAGFAGVYHVVRLGEGKVTEIEPALRWKTIRAAQKAGLMVGTCIEPVGPEHSIPELVDIIMAVRDMGPVHTGVGRRITIPGSPLEVHGELNEAQTALIVAAVKLAMGYGIIGHAGGRAGIGSMAGGNLTWAEAGSNPRDTNAKTIRGGTVKLRQDLFKEAGWEILEGPSAIFAQAM